MHLSQDQPSRGLFRSAKLLIKAIASLPWSIPGWLRCYGFRDTVRIVAGGATMATKAAVIRKRDLEMESRRLSKCSECCLHDNGFCGTPGDIDPVEMIPVGCWCVTQLGARLPEKSCWLDSQGIPGGWGEGAASQSGTPEPPAGSSQNQGSMESESL